MIQRILLSTLFGLALLLCGAESEPFDPRYNIAGLALLGLGAWLIIKYLKERKVPK